MNYARISLFNGGGVRGMSMKQVIVTGGSSGIGKALVDQLLSEGSAVYSLSRSLLPREDFAQGGTLTQLACDITDGESLDRAFDQIMDMTDSLDLLFSNAGFGISGAIADTPKAAVIRQFDVNVFSAVEVIRRAIPLLEKKQGRIILTSSVAAGVALPFQSFYSATKASLNMLALALSNELSPFGIKTIAVMPGDVATPFTEHREKEDYAIRKYSRRSMQSVARMENDERGGTPPAVIARKIIAISRKRRPKPLYGLGFFYRLTLLLFKLLPVRLTNRIIGRMYG